MNIHWRTNAEAPARGGPSSRRGCDAPATAACTICARQLSAKTQPCRTSRNRSANAANRCAGAPGCAVIFLTNTSDAFAPWPKIGFRAISNSMSSQSAARRTSPDSCCQLMSSYVPCRNRTFPLHPLRREHRGTDGRNEHRQGILFPSRKGARVSGATIRRHDAVRVTPTMGSEEGAPPQQGPALP